MNISLRDPEGLHKLQRCHLHQCIHSVISSPIFFIFDYMYIYYYHFPLIYSCWRAFGVDYSTLLILVHRKDIKERVWLPYRWDSQSRKIPLIGHTFTLGESIWVLFGVRLWFQTFLFKLVWDEGQMWVVSLSRGDLKMLCFDSHNLHPKYSLMCNLLLPRLENENYISQSPHIWSFLIIQFSVKCVLWVLDLKLCYVARDTKHDMTILMIKFIAEASTILIRWLCNGASRIPHWEKDRDTVFYSCCIW